MKKTLISLVAVGVLLSQNAPASLSEPQTNEFQYKKKTDKKIIYATDKNSNRIIDDGEIKNMIPFVFIPEKKGEYIISITNPDGKEIYNKIHLIEKKQPLLINLSKKIRDSKGGYGKYTIKVSGEFSSRVVEFYLMPKTP